MTLSKSSINKVLIISFFISIFIIGVIVYDDYNVNSDEPFHRWAGNLYYLHIREILTNFNFNNYHSLIIKERLEGAGINEFVKYLFYYPILFDLISEFLVDLFKIKETENIFKIRHFINFLFFYISGIFFYFLINKRYENFYLSLISVLFFFLSPRIFVESFYNTKDIFFLSLLVIATYYAYNFLKYNSYYYLFIYSIFTGLAVGARIYGLILPIVIFFILFFEEKKNFFKILSKNLISLIIIISIAFIFWPFLWFSPIENFLKYLVFLKYLNESFVINNLYFSKIILSNNMPWHYLPTWMIITLPVSLIFFCTFGLIYLSLLFTKNLFNFDKTNYLWANFNEKIDFLIFSIFFIFTVLSLFTNKFTGWRHFYFLFPFLIYFLINFLNLIKSFKFNIFLKILYFLIFSDLLFATLWAIKNHPFQFVYFNQIKNYIIKKNFDLDFYGISEKNVIEYILKNDNRNIINIFSLHDRSWLVGTFEILNKESKNRVVSSTLKNADYLIDNSYFEKIEVDFNVYKKYYEIIIDGNSIVRVYKNIL